MQPFKAPQSARDLPLKTHEIIAFIAYMNGFLKQIRWHGSCKGNFSCANVRNPKKQ